MSYCWIAEELGGLKNDLAFEAAHYAYSNLSFDLLYECEL
jgi:hypothetical protein